MKHLRIIGIFLVCFSINSFAQTDGPWTLQRCIDRALEYNIQVKLSALTAESNKVSVDQNVAGLLPSLNAVAGQNSFWGRSIDPYTNVFTNQEIRSNSFTLSGNVAVFQGFQLQNSLKQSRLVYLSSKNELKKVENDITINVVSAYLQVLYNEELLNATKEQVSTSTLQRDRNKRMYELGSVNKGMYLDFESQLASDELRLAQVQAQYDQSLLSLVQLLELGSLKNFSVAKPDVAIPDLKAEQLDVERVYSTALNTQPDIKRSEYQMLSAEKGLAAAKGGRSPRIFVNGALNTNYSTTSRRLVDFTVNPPSTVFSGFTSAGDSVYIITPNVVPNFEKTPFRNQFSDNLGKSVGISLQLPIFNEWNDHGNIQRARINLEQSRLNHQLNKNNLYKSVQQAVTDAISAFRKYNASQRSVEALTEAFRANQQRYEVGQISNYDFLNAKNNLARSRADLIQSKYDYIFRIKLLDFYEGKPLTF